MSEAGKKAMDALKKGNVEKKVLDVVASVRQSPDNTLHGEVEGLDWGKFLHQFINRKIKVTIEEVKTINQTDD